MKNPFELFNYEGPEYFCDREDELQELIDAFDNRRNTVLISERRLGKSQLIKHLHHHLEKRKNTLCIYVDVLNTTSDKEFISNFITAALNKLDDRKTGGRKLINFLTAFQPSVTLDALTGSPSVSFSSSNQRDLLNSMDSVMRELIGDKREIQIAIDEFQQISNYEKKSVMDATIRSYFIDASNINFLFSGSEQHILADLFSTPARPLFASTAQVALEKIGYSPYFDFIKHHFIACEIEISDNQVHHILEWTEHYTFYTHFFCNTLFYLAKDKVTDAIIQKTKNQCLRQFEHSYYTIKMTLPKNQWKLLEAVAQEQKVCNITGKEFLSKYKFSASSAAQGIEALQKKQLISVNFQQEEMCYSVPDIFFKRWVQEMR